MILCINKKIEKNGARGLKKKNDIVGFHFWKLVFVTHTQYIVFRYYITRRFHLLQRRGVSTHIAFIKRVKRSWWKQIVTDKGNRRKVKSQYYIIYLLGVTRLKAI